MSAVPKDYTGVAGIPDGPMTATEAVQGKQKVVARLQAATETVAVAATDAFLAAIERMARDPAIDVHKVEQLFALKEREQQRQAERAFNEALRQCQMEMTPVVVDAKSDKGKYATFFALDQAVRPIYTSHGFAVTFSTGDSPADCVKVIGYLLHDDGHSREYQMAVPADGAGPKGNAVMTRTHAAASALTYGKRYVLASMFNLAIDKDDDGNAAGVNDAQTEELFALLKASGVAGDAFCKRYKIEAVADLPRKLFPAAKASLELTVKDRKAPDYLK